MKNHNASLRSIFFAEQQLSSNLAGLIQTCIVNFFHNLYNFYCTQTNLNVQTITRLDLLYLYNELCENNLVSLLFVL